MGELRRKRVGRQVGVWVGVLLLALLGAACTPDAGWDLLSRLVSGEPAPIPVDESGQAIFDFPVEMARVAAVIDGDTIALAGGERVRYIGIDTPEMGSAPRECFAEQATARNAALLAGKEVALRVDVSQRDRYRRLLRYVYLPDGTFVNALLVAEGYATAATFPPDVLFSTYFATLERQARQESLGLWGACQP